MGPEQTLAERVAAVQAECASLQKEVEDLPHFLGKFHAENGMRQAQTRIGECLHRLPATARESS